MSLAMKGFLIRIAPAGVCKQRHLLIRQKGSSISRLRRGGRVYGRRCQNMSNISDSKTMGHEQALDVKTQAQVLSTPGPVSDPTPTTKKVIPTLTLYSMFLF